MSSPIKTALCLALGAVVSNNVSAGGFSLYTEGSAAAIGNYAAGIAAEARDASIGWYNPAGLVFLDKQQALIGGVGVFPSTKLTGSSTFMTVSPFGFPVFPSYTQTFSGLQGSKDALVPSFHYAQPLNDRMAFGLSIVSPFGLSTNYSNTSPVRYAATLSELLTATVSPEIAGKLSEHLAFGAGLDLQWAQVKFNRMLGAPPTQMLMMEPPTGLDSESYNKGHSFGVGFHAGFLAMFNDQHTRLGVNYQSRVNHTFNGYSELRGPLADTMLTDPTAVFRSDSLYSNDIQFPEVVTLSAYHDFNERFALLGSVVYTGWGVFKKIQLNDVAAFSPTRWQTLLSATSVQDYRNAWRFALGANYQVNKQWMLRVGGGYDQTPTIDAERDVRLPDADRWALSIGTHYQMRPCLGFDLGYTYLFARKDTTINKADVFPSEPFSPVSSYHVNAQGKPHAHLVGLQAVWTIDKAVESTK